MLCGYDSELHEHYEDTPSVSSEFSHPDVTIGIGLSLASVSAGNHGACGG